MRLFSTWFISVIFQGCISKPGFVNTVDFTASVLRRFKFLCLCPTLLKFGLLLRLKENFQVSKIPRCVKPQENWCAQAAPLSN